MSIVEFKEKIKKSGNEELINSYYQLLDSLANDFVPKEDWNSVYMYNKYWNKDRPVFEEQRKVVENELSYRKILL